MFHFDVKRTTQPGQSEKVSFVTSAETDKPLIVCDYDHVCAKVRELIGNNINSSVVDHFDQINSPFTKLIFIVSDPRQFVADFVNIEPNGNYTGAVETHCQRERDNIDFLYENDEWQRRVKVFRIEDVISVTEVTAQLTEFIGIRTSGELTQVKHQDDFTNWRSISFDIVHKTEQLCKDIIQGLLMRKHDWKGLMPAKLLVCLVSKTNFACC